MIAINHSSKALVIQIGLLRSNLSVLRTAGHRDEDCSAPFKIVVIVFPLLSTMAGSLRLFSRKMSAAELGWDDWLLVLSLLSIGLVVLYLVTCLNESFHFDPL